MELLQNSAIQAMRHKVQQKRRKWRFVQYFQQIPGAGRLLQNSAIVRGVPSVFPPFFFFNTI